MTVLLDKDLSYRPTARLLADLARHGLGLPLGTLAAGRRRLVPLFEPRYEAFVRRRRRQALWHAGAARWLAFATAEGQVGQRWQWWVFHGRAVAVCVRAAGRGHDVPEEPLGPGARGILAVERCQAYPSIDQVQRGRVVRAFGWAHVRRDLLAVARTWPDQERWPLAWVEGIGRLQALHHARLAVRPDPRPVAAAGAALRGAVTALAAPGEAALADPQWPAARREVLASRGDHGTGLTVFVEPPRCRGTTTRPNGRNGARWSVARTTTVRAPSGPASQRPCRARWCRR